MARDPRPEVSELRLRVDAGGFATLASSLRVTWSFMAQEEPGSAVEDEAAGLLRQLRDQAPSAQWRKCIDLWLSSPLETAKPSGKATERGALAPPPPKP